MNLRSTAILALAGLAACDPSGSVVNLPPTAKLRLVNFVTDAPSVTLTSGDRSVVSSLLFGQASTLRNIGALDTVLVVTRVGDGVEVGADTIIFVDDRQYTFYALGSVADFRARTVVDDTINAAAGSIKLRIVNGLATHAASDIDFYASAPGVGMAGLIPHTASLPFGGAGSYVATDTSLRRFRFTLEGDTVAVFDTTFVTPFPSTSVITVVVADKSGGGTPFKLLTLTDQAP